MPNSQPETSAASQAAPLPAVVPAVDLLESENGYLLRVDLPGVREDRVNLEFERGVLTLHAPRGEPARFEYRRAFRISEEVQIDAIKAELRGGVLDLTLPKAPEVRARRIAVKSG